MAKMLGARVFTTVSTKEKAQLSRDAGADETILYTQVDFAAEVKRLTDGKGLPVVYDSVGKSTFEQSLACLRSRGSMVLFGGSSGAVPPFDLIRLSQMGSLYVTRPTLKGLHRHTRRPHRPRRRSLQLARRRNAEAPHRSDLSSGRRRASPPRPRIAQDHWQGDPHAMTLNQSLSTQTSETSLISARIHTFARTSALIALIALPAAAHAVIVRGTVTDPLGAVVAGARVRLVQGN